MSILLKTTVICLLMQVSNISLADMNNSDHGNLYIIVKGISSDDGTVMIALFNSRNDYEADGEKNNAFIAVSADVSNQSSEYVFKDIPYGEYAIKLFHDKNGNSKLDKNFFGGPKEPYGFSNNIQKKLSQPAWESVMFKVDSGNVTQKIEVK